MVPEGEFYKGVNRILFSWDPNNLAAGNGLILLKELATKLHHSQVQVLHIEREHEFALGNPKSRKARLEQVMEDVSHTFRTLEEDDIPDGIERELKEFNADILVMVSQKAGILGSFFHESRTH